MFLILVLGSLLYGQALSKNICHYGKEGRILCPNNNLQQMEKLFIKNITHSVDLSNYNLEHLRYILISNSRIDVVALGQAPKLDFLNIYKNKKFPNLTKSFFENVSHLNWLGLVGNTHNIQEDSLHLLKNLTWLHIENQNLEHLAKDFLKENSQLHELAVKNCKLETVDPAAFKNTPNLEILSFNFNKLRFFEDGTFVPLKKLKILELHHNNKFVKFGDFAQFRGLKSLEILGLPSKFIKHVEIQDLVKSFPQLKKIELKRNDRNEEILKKIRQSGIEVIGTPHDCHNNLIHCNVSLH